MPPPLGGGRMPCANEGEDADRGRCSIEAVPPATELTTVRMFSAAAGKPRSRRNECRGVADNPVSMTTTCRSPSGNADKGTPATTGGEQHAWRAQGRQLWEGYSTSVYSTAVII